MISPCFVFDPKLPPTNNDAERALRHAVIGRRISFGTRTDEGSCFHAAALSVIDTYRKGGVETWGYVASLIAAARETIDQAQRFVGRSQQQPTRVTPQRSAVKFSDQQPPFDPCKLARFRATLCLHRASSPESVQVVLAK